MKLESRNKTTKLTVEITEGMILINQMKGGEYKRVLTIMGEENAHIKYD